MSKKKIEYTLDLEQYRESVSNLMSDEDYTRISLLQYKNFRHSFNTYLKTPILGEDYYNLGMDTYNCDIFTCQDLKYKYDKLKSSRNTYAVITVILLIVNMLLWIFR